MKSGKIFKYISNISFGLGVVLSVISLYLVFSARVGAPAGTCPVNSNLPLIIPAIGLLAIAFITSFFAEKKTKKASPDKPPDKTE